MDRRVNPFVFHGPESKLTEPFRDPWIVISEYAKQLWRYRNLGIGYKMHVNIIQWTNAVIPVTWLDKYHSMNKRSYPRHMVGQISLCRRPPHKSRCASIPTIT